MDSTKQSKKVKPQNLESKIEVDTGEFRDMLIFDLDMAEGMKDKKKFQKAAEELSIFDHYYRTTKVKCYYLSKEEKYIYETNKRTKMGF